MTDHLCHNRHRILAVLQSLGAEPDSAEVAEVFQAVGAIAAESEREGRGQYLRSVPAQFNAEENKP